MAITVKNNSSSTINVAINQWGDDGDTSYFEIDANDQESWDRSDDRGYVMYLTESGVLDGPYYLRAGDTATFSSSSVSGATKV